jgi:orotidine-5'-phosphate decarboxylase
MGEDSVRPFADYGKGVYVLVRTSNPGAKDFQDSVFKIVAQKVIDWKCGAVVGATYPDELKELAKLFAPHKVPLLIPGVGSQGGSAKDVTLALSEAGYDLSLVRINVSSSATYSYEGEESSDYAGACVRYLKKLRDELNA